MKPGSLDRTFAEGYDWTAIIATPSKVEYNPPQSVPNKVYGAVILDAKGRTYEWIDPDVEDEFKQQRRRHADEYWPANGPHTLHTLYISP
jgi:hypothetical protein